MSRSTLGAFVSALIILTPNIAAAGETNKDVAVSLEGIDTSSTQGADHALRRIRNAAENACDVQPGLQSYSERRAARACVNEAVAKAVDDLADPVVTARYRGARSYASAGARS